MRACQGRYGTNYHKLVQHCNIGMSAHMSIDGALFVPKREEEAVGVHGDVKDARNFPLALNANALQIL